MLDFFKDRCYYGSMILKKSDENGSLFFVGCANWEASIVASSPEEASALAIENAYKKYGKNMCLSPAITVADMKDLFETFDPVESIHILYTPEVLANAGLYELAKKFKKIISRDIDES